MCSIKYADTTPYQLTHAVQNRSNAERTSARNLSSLTYWELER